MLDQKLIVKATQGLVITKNMQQSLQILQMSTQDLQEFISQQLEENPYIERIEHIASENLEGLRYESVHTKRTCNLHTEEYLDNIQNHQISLKEHLLNQIMLEITDPKERLIAVSCTDYLDESGYFTESIPKISEIFKCKISSIKHVLNKLYKLDPVGVYAQNLSECLELQLKDQGIYDKTFGLILQKLNLLANGELSKLAKHSGVNIEELKERIYLIKKLKPKPGINYSNEMVSSLIPDVFIYFDNYATLRVALNEPHLPKIAVNHDLYKQSLNTSNKEELDFCKTKFHSAMMVSKALTQRAQTVYKVASVIASEQSEFFEKGINFLKPMILSDVATLSQLHESTISRISNKVIASPVGTFEIKHFFTSKIKSNFTENIFSSSSIKNQIKDIIENEGIEIFSDDKISQVLKSKGVELSRRTVTKYREEMRLPASHERKRLKVTAIIK